MRLPAGLVVPDEADGARLLSSLPGRPRAPGWWGGRAARRSASLAVSPGAVGLNTQALALLRAAEASRARCLVVVAPHVSDEALATLLLNDLARVLPDGILPLQVQAPEFHVAELIDRVAEYLGVPLWDGRPAQVPLLRVQRVRATTEAMELELELVGPARGVGRRRWPPWT